MGRTWQLEKEGRVDEFAQAYAEGLNREQLAGMFGCSVESITNWSKRPEIQRRVSALNTERANRVLRAVDTALENRLRNVENLDIETLLKIRKEFAGDKLEITTKVDQNELAQELWAKLDSDPEAIDRLMAGVAAD